MTNYEYRLNALRNGLISAISLAVRQAGECVGTMYKNIGIRYLEYEIESGNVEIYSYDETPNFAVKHTGHFIDRYEAYEGVVCWEIFNENWKTFVVVHGVSGDDCEIEIDSIPLEGLLSLHNWLIKHGFIKSDDPWRCSECGSLDIEELVWWDPNTQVISDTETIPTNKNKTCISCLDEEAHFTKHTRESELLKIIENWWDLGDHILKNKITRYTLDDYPITEEGVQQFEADCEKYWSELTVDQKIDHWRNNKTSQI